MYRFECAYPFSAVLLLLLLREQNDGNRLFFAACNFTHSVIFMCACIIHVAQMKFASNSCVFVDNALYPHRTETDIQTRTIAVFDFQIIATIMCVYIIYIVTLLPFRCFNTSNVWISVAIVLIRAQLRSVVVNPIPICLSSDNNFWPKIWAKRRNKTFLIHRN